MHDVHHPISCRPHENEAAQRGSDSESGRKRSLHSGRPDGCVPSGRAKQTALGPVTAVSVSMPRAFHSVPTLPDPPLSLLSDMATAATDFRSAPENGEYQTETTSGSKFKRFLRKFGRKLSDDAQEAGEPGQNGGGTVAVNGSSNGNPSSQGKRGNKQRGNSLLGKGIGSRSRHNSSAPYTPAAAAQTSPQKRTDAPTFAGHSGHGLADTLVMPSDSGAASNAATSPPPQISGLPSHEPLSSIEVAGASPAAAGDTDIAAVQTLATTANAPVSKDRKHRISDSPTATMLPGSSANEYASAPNESNGSASVSPNGRGFVSAGGPLQSESSGSPARSRADTTSFDLDSTEGIRKRDSADNRTIDTGKSTKPTTLMSLDTREQPPTSMAHIAQFRHGDQPPTSSSPTSSAYPRITSGGSGSAVQFAASPQAQRNGIGLPISNEPADNNPYVNVPAISRPHPSNNPNPSAMPPDNASVLTLASSTAAHSIGGGAASSRGHHHTPSLGGARSIGGSLMGERRNSSDTYASVKALPPLSRRGSDESARTGRESIAASATGLSSAQAMTASASTANVNVAGPGAPYDRLSIQRTPSQRTVATQLSIPLSSSSAALVPSDRRASSGSAHLLAQATPTLASGATMTPQPNKEGSTPSESIADGAMPLAGLGVTHHAAVPAITQTGPSASSSPLTTAVAIDPVEAESAQADQERSLQSAPEAGLVRDMPGGLPTPGV